MKHDVTALQYMRAHGNTPGPTHRPYLTGAISGLFAGAIAIIVKYWSAALASEATSFRFSLPVALAVDILFFAFAGVIYAAAFRRAANDHKGGWLFGSSYGFLIWMLGPVAIWQLAAQTPLATGRAAIGLFCAQILYGTILGGLFPYIHQTVQSKLR